MGSTALDAGVSDDLDSVEPSDLPSDFADTPSDFADLLSVLGSADGESGLVSDLDSEEFFESDAADFLYDSLR